MKMKVGEIQVEGTVAECVEFAGNAGIFRTVAPMRVPVEGPQVAEASPLINSGERGSAVLGGVGNAKKHRSPSDTSMFRGGKAGRRYTCVRYKAILGKSLFKILRDARNAGVDVRGKEFIGELVSKIRPYVNMPAKKLRNRIVHNIIFMEHETAIAGFPTMADSGNGGPGEHPPDTDNR